MKLRIGVVGLGEVWEYRHAPALRALSDRFQVQAVCDAISHRARAVANQWNVRSVDGFHSLAASNDVDAVFVLSPDWLGEAPILAACDAGKAVYCAAALGARALPAAEWRVRVEEAGIAFVAEFPCRHSPATLRLKELIATHLGKPRHLFCVEQTAETPRGKPTEESTVRLLHLVDWCRFIVGADPTSVSGVADSRHGAFDRSNYLVANLRFDPPVGGEAGPLALVRWDALIPSSLQEARAFRVPANMQVFCERGIAYIDLPDKLIWFDDAGQHVESLEHDRPVGEQLLLDFHRSVTSLVRKTTSLHDAFLAIEIVNAVRQSCEERRWVDLPRTERSE